MTQNLHFLFDEKHIEVFPDCNISKFHIIWMKTKRVINKFLICPSCTNVTYALLVQKLHTPFLHQNLHTAFLHKYYIHPTCANISHMPFLHKSCQVSIITKRIIKNHNHSFRYTQGAEIAT